MSLILTSSAFVHGGEIPERHGCEGENLSPDLAWSGVPPACRSLVLLIDDPDAPDPRAPRMVWDHWLLYNLPPDCQGLPAGVREAELPAGTRQGLNSWGRTSYGGPCPPSGTHRYFFKVYALDTLLALKEGATKAELLKAMEGHVLAQGQLMGKYKRS